MAIATLAQLQAAMQAGQIVNFKTSSVVPGQNAWGDHSGNIIVPSGGVLAGTSTAAGVVPNDSTSGCPAINSFGAGNTGYLGAVALTTTYTLGSPTGGRVRVHDQLFKAGAYSFNANVTLASQPSYSARIPGADYKGTEIWITNVTAFTGTLALTITYTNQDGTTGRSTTANSPGTSAGRIWQMPLAAGDTGVQKIESVVGATATVGTFNVQVLRPLFTCRIPHTAEELFFGPDKTDLPILFDTSALFFTSLSELSSNSNLTFDAALTVING